MEGGEAEGWLRLQGECARRCGAALSSSATAAESAGCCDGAILPQAAKRAWANIDPGRLAGGERGKERNEILYHQNSPNYNITPKKVQIAWLLR